MILFCDWVETGALSLSLRERLMEVGLQFGPRRGEGGRDRRRTARRGGSGRGGHA
jgi:hypothetical protein